MGCPFGTLVLWDRSSIRTDDPVNGRYTLYSALATACHEVTGR
jgi:hypothetical protein